MSKGADDTGFTPRERRLVLRGEIERDGHRYRITLPRPKGGQVARQGYDFSGHPLRHLLERFIMDDVEGENAGTLNAKCRSLKALGDFLRENSEANLNPEVFSAYCRWLFEPKGSAKKRLAESSIAPRLYAALSLYEFGMRVGQEGWNQRDLDTMRAAATKVSRGRYKRHLQDTIDKVLSLEAYASLARAVALEFEQCKRVLHERDSGARQSLYNLGQNTMRVLDPNPFVVFALQCAMRLGLRATELNSLTRQDVRVDYERGHHEIYVHAPDKGDDFIPVDETFLVTLRVCQEWDREAREAAGPEAASFLKDVLKDALLVYRPTSSCYGRPFFPLSTYYLNSSHLKYFFKKWFDFKLPGEGGVEVPLLHADGDPSRPLRIDYRRLRNSFAVRFVERERNRGAVQRVMRHKSIFTTERYYLRQTRLDHAKKVQIALKAEARLLVAGLTNAAGAGVSEETLQRARAAGALTPHGVCGVALEGGVCERASDCLECPHLVIIASRRPRLVADRDAYLKISEKFHAQGDVRGAENALGRAKLCQAQIHRIDDTFNPEP